MTQQQKSVPSNRHLAKLASREANQQKKRCNANREATEVANLFNQFFNGVVTLNFIRQQMRKNKKKKEKKSALSDQICQVSEPSNSSTEQMDIVDQAMGIHFQEELIMEILSRLPVRSLHRFKCVSKLWKALISDPYFKRKHLNHAKDDPNLQKFFAGQMHEEDDMFNFYFSSLSAVPLVVDEHKLDCPLNVKPVNSKIYCCYDGLVLLTVYDGVNEHYLLWNPSTRESIVLPQPESPLFDCVCGLGYDATSDDYKILSLNLDVERFHRELSVEILSLKSGAWRKIDKYPTGVRRVSGFRGCGMDALAVVHGAFHWVGLAKYYTIVSLDIANEVYGEIPLVEGMGNLFKTMYMEHGVSVLGGMLCFYSTYNNELGGGVGLFKLWVMKDYGVKESWTGLLMIHSNDLFHSARPKHRYANGEVLLFCGHHRRIGRVYRTSRGPFGLWPECVSRKYGFIYTESLISPKLST